MVDLVRNQIIRSVSISQKIKLSFTNDSLIIDPLNGNFYNTEYLHELEGSKLRSIVFYPDLLIVLINDFQFNLENSNWIDVYLEDLVCDLSGLYFYPDYLNDLKESEYLDDNDYRWTIEDKQEDSYLT